MFFPAPDGSTKTEYRNISSRLISKKAQKNQRNERYVSLFSNVRLQETISDGLKSHFEYTPVSSAAFPVSYRGRVVPGTYNIELDIQIYKPEKNGLVTIGSKRREILKRNIVVTENKERILVLD